MVRVALLATTAFLLAGCTFFGGLIGVSTVNIINNSSVPIAVEYGANGLRSGVFDLQPGTEVSSTRACLPAGPEDASGQIWVDDLSNGEGIDIEASAAIECGPGLTIRVVDDGQGGIELRLEPF